MDTIKYLDNEFYKTVEKYINYKSKFTGFEQLDKYLGGITPGLYLLGAESSVGKTTFILQIADYMAQHGDNVLFFSLEMARFELICKSLSRISYAEYKEPATQKNIQFNTDPALTREAFDYYREHIAPGIQIIQGDFDLTVCKKTKENKDGIREIVAKYQETKGLTPIVIIDYLQVLQPNDPRTLTRESIDRNLTELKRLSRDLFVPVFVISSLNRANYGKPIDYISFKESGGIEYTVDVLLGLQYSIVNELTWDSKKGKDKENKAKIGAEKGKPIRDIELVCKKNRTGKQQFSIKFDYFSEYNYFIEQSTNCQDNDIFNSEDILPF